MNTHRRPFQGWLCPLLALLVAFPPNAAAQAPAAQPPQPAAAPQLDTIRSLKVVVLAGNKEMNDLENKVMAPLVVQVLDQNDVAVEGADVMFRFPIDGPGATFPDRKLAKTFRTNADGQAPATGWMANGTVGTFEVHITASRGHEQGSAVITMTNVTRIVGDRRTAADKKKWYSTKWGRIAIIAGAAGIAAAAVLATRGSSPTVITGTPGGPTIGGPQ